MRAANAPADLSVATAAARPRHGIIYGLAYLCVRYPFVSAAVIAMTAAVAATQILPIANDSLRELIASAIGIVSYLSWAGLTETNDGNTDPRCAVKFLA